MVVRDIEMGRSVENVTRPTLVKKASSISAIVPIQFLVYMIITFPDSTVVNMAETEESLT